MTTKHKTKTHFLQIISFFIVLSSFCTSIECIQEINENLSSGNEIEESETSVDDHNVKVAENRMAAQIFAIIEHYKQEDPVGFPGAPIPDPMDVPDMKKGIAVGTLSMMKVKAHGLSKFRIQSLRADLKAMRVDAALQLDNMLVEGSYTLSSFMSRASGPFTVKLKNVVAKGKASLIVQTDGQLTTDTISIDMTFGDMSTDFQNLGFFGSVFQSFINSAPTLVFDAMKPFMLKETDKKLREEINQNIVKLMGDRRLPNSITPLDMAIAEGRKKVKGLGYDPYTVPGYNRTVGVFSMQMSNVWISGISSFYRHGDMIVSMENNTLSINFQLATQQITGAGEWEIGLGLVSRVGHIQFSIQHIRATVNISQSLDTRKRPVIKDFQLVLGNIQIRSDGAGTLDYILEFGINVLPNLLRYQIMDALENPIKVRIQEKLNTIDVEKAIKENIDKFEKMGKDFAFDFKI